MGSKSDSGKDPRNGEDIWQLLYRGAYFRRGPIAMAAFGAIDLALWDIKAKLADMPLYQLFGGKSRENRETIPATVFWYLVMTWRMSSGSILVAMLAGGQQPINLGRAARQTFAPVF